MFRAEVVKRKRAYFAPVVFVLLGRCNEWEKVSAMSHCVHGFLLIYTVCSVKYATGTTSPSWWLSEGMAFWWRAQNAKLLSILKSPPPSGPQVTISNSRVHLSPRTWCRIAVIAFTSRFNGHSHWPRGLSRGSAAARLLELWVRIPPGVWMFLVSVVCCRVAASATGWSLVQRSRTECGVSEWSRNLVSDGAWAHYSCRDMKVGFLKTLQFDDVSRMWSVSGRSCWACRWK